MFPIITAEMFQSVRNPRRRTCISIDVYAKTADWPSAGVPAKTREICGSVDCTGSESLWRQAHPYSVSTREIRRTAARVQADFYPGCSPVRRNAQGAKARMSLCLPLTKRIPPLPSSGNCRNCGILPSSQSSSASNMKHPGKVREMRGKIFLRIKDGLSVERTDGHVHISHSGYSSIRSSVQAGENILGRSCGTGAEGHSERRNIRSSPGANFAS